MTTTTTTTLEDKIYNIFKENKLSYDYSVIGDNVEIEIYWGDWKHDHCRLKNIMSNNGFMCIDEHITDSDEDCYDAEYTFIPMYSIEYDF